MQEIIMRKISFTFKLISVLTVALVGFSVSDPGSNLAASADPIVEPGAKSISVNNPIWHELPSPEYLWPSKTAVYYTFQTQGGTRVHLVVVDLKSGEWTFRPAVNTPVTGTAACAERFSASAATNGGFFNLHAGGDSTSYALIDGKEAADPRANKLLMSNQRLVPYLDTILNRTEVRFLKDQHGKPAIQICPHRTATAAGMKLVHSLQGGPRLLPELTSVEEAFIRTESDGSRSDAIGCLKPASRTAFGITPDGYAMMICTASPKQDPESHGLTLAELAKLLKDLGCTEAVNLDGGGSTTMFIRPLETVSTSGQAAPARVVCGRSPETLVKTVLLLLPTNK
jgi:hypothetical protein